MKTLRQLVALVSLSSTGATASRFAVLLYAAQFGASPATVGLLAGLFAAVGALASVPAGRMIDRVGTKKPLLFSAVLLAVAMSVGVYWRDLPMLFVIVVLSGLAHNIMIIAFQRLAGDLAPPNARAEAFGMLGFGFSISLLSAPLIAGFAIDLVGFAGAFMLFALLPLGSFIMVWTNRPPMSPPAGARGDHKAGTAPARSGTLGLLGLPALKRLWVCGAMFEAGWMAFNFMLPVVGTQLGFSASRIGLIAGAAGFMLFLTRGALTPLLRRFSPWQLLITGMALQGLGFTGFALAGEFLWMVACAGLIGMGQGACSPMQNALVYEHAPSHEKGEAMALRTLISNAAQGSTPLIAGALTAAVGVEPVFLALAAGLAGALWLARPHWHRRQPAGKAP